MDYLQIGACHIQIHDLAHGINHLELPSRSRILGAVKTDSGVGVTVMEPEMSMSSSTFTLLLVRGTETFWPRNRSRLRHLGDISVVGEDNQTQTNWHVFEERTK